MELNEKGHNIGAKADGDLESRCKVLIEQNKALVEAMLEIRRSHCLSQYRRIGEIIDSAIHAASASLG